MHTRYGSGCTLGERNEAAFRECALKFEAKSEAGEKRRLLVKKSEVFLSPFSAQWKLKCKA